MMWNALACPVAARYDVTRWMVVFVRILVAPRGAVSAGESPMESKSTYDTTMAAMTMIATAALGTRLVVAADSLGCVVPRLSISMVYIVYSVSWYSILIGRYPSVL